MSTPTTGQPPTFETLPDYLHHYAASTPDWPCATFRERKYSYAEMEGLVERTARALLHQGIAVGDRVGMLTTPRPEYLAVFLALTEIGATWVGLNPRFTNRELGHIVSDSQPRLLLCLAESSGRDAEAFAVLAEEVPLPQTVAVGASLPGTLSFTEFLDAGDSVPEGELAARRQERTGDEAAALVYTSGTTGAPKGALLSARGLSRASQLQAGRQYQPQMSALSYLPIDHIGGLIDLGGVPLVTGGTLNLHAKFDPDEVLRAIPRDRITLWGGIPTVFALTMARPQWSRTDLSSLRRIGWGGAAMPSGLLGPLRATGATLASVYGLTEACVTVTYGDDDADDATITTTIGRPDDRLGGVRLANTDDQPVEVGEVGEIQVKDSAVMLGYLNNPAATAAAFAADGYLRTGDLARAREDGNFTLVGRSREMFKSGGYNVYPREVELVLEATPGITAAAVVSRNDDTYGEVGVAYVQHDGSAQIDAELLRSVCRANLANYKVPKQFTVLEELPTLANGKLDKQTLRARTA